MKDTAFIIIRRPEPGQIREKLRYLSVGYGWTTNRDLAKEFDTKAQASAALHGRPGEIVPDGFNNVLGDQSAKT